MKTNRVMKKPLLLLTIAILGGSFSMKGQNVDFGLKAGLNIANITGGEIDRNNVFDIHFGVFADFEIFEKFSIQPELLYSKQGSEVNNGDVIKLDYLAIPFMAKYYLSKNVSVEAGPQMSFLINDELKYENATGSGAIDLDASSFDFGLNFGFGYNISSHLLVQARYNLGITTIGENPDIKNSVFQLSLGYKF